MTISQIDQWHRDKANRAAFYFAFVFGWKQRDCTACNGSGHYDSNDSPSCGGCDGSGKETFKGPKYLENAFMWHAPKLFEIWKSMKDTK